MNEMANKIQAVINTLQGLDIKSTFDNTSKLFGCYQVLAEVRDALNSMKEDQDGNDHAE